MSLESNDPKDMIDELILNGALEIQGLDMETGQIVFSVTEKMIELAPELYYEIEESIHKVIMSLWEKGFLAMDVTAVSPNVSPTEAALDRNNWDVLSEEQRHVMNTVMRAFEGGI